MNALYSYTHTWNLNSLRTFGDTYSCGAYGSGAYNSADSCTDSGGLASTGYDVLIPLALGIVLVLTSVSYLIVSFVKRHKQAKATR